MASIPRAEPRPHSPLQAIPGRPPSLADLPADAPSPPGATTPADQCRTERPPLRSDEARRTTYACWYPIGSPGLGRPSPDAAADGRAAHGRATNGCAAAGRVTTGDVVHLRPGRPVARVTDLVVEYPAGAGRRVHAVSNVSFDVARGRPSAWWGSPAAGSRPPAGPSSACHPPTSGSVVFDGVDLATLSGDELRRIRTRMQVIFQDPVSSLNPGRRIADIVAEPLSVWGHDQAKRIATPASRR